MPDCPNGTTKRLPRGRDCVGGVLARAAGARLRELPSAAAQQDEEATPEELPPAAAQQDEEATPEELPSAAVQQDEEATPEELPSAAAQRPKSTTPQKIAPGILHDTISRKHINIYTFFSPFAIEIYRRSVL